MQKWRSFGQMRAEYNCTAHSETVDVCIVSNWTLRWGIRLNRNENLCLKFLSFKCNGAKHWKDANWYSGIRLLHARRFLSDSSVSESDHFVYKPLNVLLWLHTHTAVGKLRKRRGVSDIESSTAFQPNPFRPPLWAPVQKSCSASRRASQFRRSSFRWLVSYYQDLRGDVRTFAKLSSYHQPVEIHPCSNLHAACLRGRCHSSFDGFISVDGQQWETFGSASIRILNSPVCWC